MDEIEGFLKFKHLPSASTVLPPDRNILKESGSEVQGEQNHKYFLQTGRWTLEEQCEYLRFIESHKSFLSCKEERRSAKIFKQMSKFIKTRGPDQCRSHHQKTQKKYDTISNIIANCQKNLSRLRENPKMQQRKLSVAATEAQVQDFHPKIEEVSQRSEADKLVQAQVVQEESLFYYQKCRSPFGEIDPPSIEEMFEVDHDNLEMLLCDSPQY